MLFSKREYAKPVPKHLPNLALQGNVVQRYSYEKGVNNPSGRHGIPIPNSAYNTQHDVNRAMLLQTLRKKYFTHAKYRGEIDWDIMAVAQTYCILPFARAVTVKVNKRLSKYSDKLLDEGQNYGMDLYLPKMSEMTTRYHIDKLVDELYSMIKDGKDIETIQNSLSKKAIVRFGFTRLPNNGHIMTEEVSEAVESAVKRNAPFKIIQDSKDIEKEIHSVKQVIEYCVQRIRYALQYVSKNKRPSKWHYDNELERWNNIYYKFQPKKYARRVYNILDNDWGTNYYFKRWLKTMPSIEEGHIGKHLQEAVVPNHSNAEDTRKLLEDMQELTMPKYISEDLSNKITQRAETNFRHVVDYLSQQGGRHGIAKFPPFIGRKPVREALRKLTVTQGEYGVKPRNVHRIITDRKVFKRRNHIAGGSVMIDCSGSMGFDSRDVTEIVELLPASNIAGYTGYGHNENGFDGVVKIIARNGRIDTEAIDYLQNYGLNSVDFDALKWLAKQEEPRIWVSDMQVVGVNENGGAKTLHGEGVSEIMRFMAINNILPIQDIEHVKEYAKQYSKFVG